MNVPSNTSLEEYLKYYIDSQSPEQIKEFIDKNVQDEIDKLKNELSEWKGYYDSLQERESNAMELLVQIRAEVKDNKSKCAKQINVLIENSYVEF